MRPTRELGRAALKRSSIWSCTGWGLPSFPGHPRNWCALTAPFHPYRPRLLCGEAKPAVCFLLHFPSRHRDSALRSTLPCGVRTFLREHTVPAIVWSAPAGCRTRCSISTGYISGVIPIQNSITEGAQFQAVKPLQFIVGLGRDIHVAAHTN